MSTSATPVLRTVYIDELVDSALADYAAATGASRADVFRRWLKAGVRAVRRGDKPLTIAPAPTAPLILRTVELSHKVDQLLRVEAFDSRISRNDLLRSYLLVGYGLSQSTVPA